VSKESAKPSRKEVETDYGWAIEIVRSRFENGLAEICDQRFLNRRYKDFQDKQDPIYPTLLKGMNDEPLSKTFVSYWTIAHTLATQSLAISMRSEAGQAGKTGV
jgi:hypothetical protein